MAVITGHELEANPIDSLSTVSIIKYCWFTDPFQSALTNSHRHSFNAIMIVFVDIAFDYQRFYCKSDPQIV